MKFTQNLIVIVQCTVGMSSLRTVRTGFVESGATSALFSARAAVSSMGLVVSLASVWLLVQPKNVLAQDITQGGGNGSDIFLFSGAYGSGGIAAGGGGGGAIGYATDGGNGGNGATLTTPAGAGTQGQDGVGGTAGAGANPGSPNDLSAGGGGGGGGAGGDVAFTGNGGAGGNGGSGTVSALSSTVLDSDLTGGDGEPGISGDNYGGRGGGGGGGGALVLTADGATLNTAGFSVAGGKGGDGGGNGGGGGGGVAITLMSGGTITVENSSVVTGGNSGTGYEAAQAGAAVFLFNGGTLINEGLAIIQGGSGASALAGSGNGNAGVLANRGEVNNNGGSIRGGSGGAGFNGGHGGGGMIVNATVVTNSGEIAGGNGANSTASPGFTFPSGSGGAGITFINSGGSLENTGSISGGNGGTTSGLGNGGAGVRAGSGVLVVNEGSISGGLHGDGATRANAVELAGNNNTLELRNGYSFTGNVVAFGGGNILAWGGSANTSFDVSDISDSGLYRGFAGVLKTGGSLWTLDGTGSYAGTTVIEEGTLALGSTGSIGASSEVVVQALGSFDVSGVADPGTTIQGLSGSGAVALGAKDLTLGSVNDTVFSGAISGTGDLIKTNTGALILSGTNTHSGTTHVDAGSLWVNGSLGSTAVIVADGAFLGGSGNIVGSVIVNSGGTLSPGNSPGILTLGELTLQSGSATVMEINGLIAGTEHDQIRVTGNATLGGTLELVFGGSYTPRNSDQFVLFDSDNPITGDFDQVINPLGNAIVYTIAITDDYTFTINAVQTAFEAFATTANQAVVAGVIDAEFDAPGLLDLIDELNSLPGAALPFALDLIAPEELLVMSDSAFSNSRAVFGMLGSRFREIRDGRRFSARGLALPDLSHAFRQSLWAGTGAPPAGLQAITPSLANDPDFGYFVNAQGTFGDIDENGSSAGYDFDTGGMLLGADYRIAERTAAGIYAGYQGTEADTNGGGSTDVRSAKFGAYAAQWWDAGAWVNISVGGAILDYDTHRLSVGGYADGSTTGTELNSQLQFGWDWRVGKNRQWTFGVEAELAYVRLWIDPFTEQGSLSPLSIEEQKIDSLRSTFGGRVGYDWKVKNLGWTVRPYASTGWRHEFMDASRAISAAFAGGGGGLFTVNGPETVRDSLTVGTGIGVVFSETVSASLGYNGDMNADYRIHNVTGSVSVQF